MSFSSEELNAARQRLFDKQSIFRNPSFCDRYNF